MTKDEVNKITNDRSIFYLTCNTIELEYIIMKILVCIKAVPEPEHAIHTESGVMDVRIDDTTDIRMSRFDEFAVEEAVLIKESFPETIVEAITVGPENAVKVIKRAIGMGADKGIHILSDYQTSSDAAAVSSAIAGFAGEKHYDLIFCGIMSEDMMQFSVGPMVAQRLSFPWTTSVIASKADPENRKIRVEQELEGGVKAIIEMKLPALLTIQSGTNEPRYPSLSNLLRANKSRIHTMSADTLHLPESACRTVAYAYPDKKRAGRVLAGTAEEKAETLFTILREKSLI